MSVMSNLDLIRQSVQATNPKGNVFAWYVVGETKLYETPFPTFFRTKIQAEEYARELFPEESAHRRYARIQYREVI